MFSGFYRCNNITVFSWEWKTKQTIQIKIHCQKQKTNNNKNKPRTKACRFYFTRPIFLQRLYISCTCFNVVKINENICFGLWAILSCKSNKCITSQSSLKTIMQLSVLSDDICRHMLFTNARKKKTRHNPSPLWHHRVFFGFFLSFWFACMHLSKGTRHGP